MATSQAEVAANESAQPQDGSGTQDATQVQSSPAVAPPAQPQPKRYFASISPGPNHPLPPAFVDTIQALEKTLGMPLWLLLQDRAGEAKYDEVNEEVRKAFWHARKGMTPNAPIALLIDSPGGYAKSAYQIATLLRHHCGEFTAVIPRSAKSAATLLTLGANTLILNKDAELGPLDVQIFDFEREEYASALNEVQTVERLQAASMMAIDQTMMLLVGRTGKKVDTVLPHVLRFVSDMMRPMFENIDVVHFTQRARALKVAEECAIRLLRPRHSKEHAERIARRLVDKYPEHGFVIDVEETADPEMNLETKQPTDEQVNLMDSLVPLLGGVTIIGQLQEVTTKP